MSVEVCLSNSGYNNTKNLITMPVVSQRRSSTSSTTTTSPLTGSYRSTSSSDRSYYGGTSTTTSTFSRNSYLRNLDSKRVYSRHTSISEDSGIGSRTSSYTRSDRETSIRRGDSQPHDISGLTLTGRRISSISIANSVDDIRQKYSPSNYVPNIRKPESNKLEITRSKSITNDIGKPPTVVERKISPSIERKTSPSSVERRVNKVITNMPINSLSVSTNTEKVIEENAEENDDVTKEDNNGNVQQQSVSEIRKIFDTPAVVGKLTSVIPPFLKNGTNSGKYDIATKSNELNQNLKLSNSKNNHLQNNGNNVRWTFLSTALPNLDNMCDISELNKDLEQPNTSTNNHTTNFASYIPVNVYETQPVGDCSVSEQTDNIGTEIDTVEQQQGNSVPLDQTSPDDTDTTSTTNFDMSLDTQHDFKGRTTARLPATDAHYLGDLSTSPRLNRSTIASTNGSSTISALNRSSPLERHREEKTTNSYNSKSDKNIGLNGLKNIGNTCFMNSVIQCLSNTRLLLEYLRDNTYLNDINTTNSSMKGALVKAFANVIQELWGDDSDKIVNPSSLKYQIQHFAPRFMGYAQQDAQEFLRYLLEGLHEDVNRVKAKPPPILTEIDDKLSDSQKSMEAWNRYLRIDDSNIVDIFVGQLKSTLKCSVCGYCSVTFDPFWDLSLPIGSGSITQCLENFTREEVMDGHEKPTCSKCQTRRKCTKSFSIQKFPKILVLHLKRFSPNERFRGKLTTLIDFPLQNLDLSAFAANRGTSSVYNLYAVSNHSGTTYSGHYTAYCKHPYSGEWHEYNDSRVSTISSRHVVSSEAYVLFYELSGHSSHL